MSCIFLRLCYTAIWPFCDRTAAFRRNWGIQCSSWVKIPFSSSSIVQNLSVFHTLSCLFVWSSPAAKCVSKGDKRVVCGWLTAYWILLSPKPGHLLVWASMSRGGGFCPTKTISTEGFCPEELIMEHRQLRHKAPPPHALPLEQCIYGVSTHWGKRW